MTNSYRNEPPSKFEVFPGVHPFQAYHRNENGSGNALYRFIYPGNFILMNKRMTLYPTVNSPIPPKSIK